MKIQKHIQDLQDSLEELNGMQDRILDDFNSQSKDQKNLLIEISSLKEEIQDLIYCFESLQ
jgi:peptidoglycan hydrolase CwlO-like protein